MGDNCDAAGGYRYRSCPLLAAGETPEAGGKRVSLLVGDSEAAAEAAQPIYRALTAAPIRDALHRIPTSTWRRGSMKHVTLSWSLPC